MHHLLIREDVPRPEAVWDMSMQQWAKKRLREGERGMHLFYLEITAVIAREMSKSA